MGPNILLIGYAGLNLIFLSMLVLILVFPALLQLEKKIALSNMLSPAPLTGTTGTSEPFSLALPSFGPLGLNLWCILWLCCCFGYLAGLWSVLNLVLVSGKWTDIILIDPIYYW
jgi:hypothetical protein